MRLLDAVRRGGALASKMATAATVVADGAGLRAREGGPDLLLLPLALVSGGEGLGYVTWSPPEYNMSRPPRLLLSKELEGASLDEARSRDPSVFARMAKWCRHFPC